MQKATLAAALTLALASSGLAQEHPEHPKPTDKAKTTHAYSMDELDKAITSDINAAQQKNGGWYKMDDPKTGKTLTMKLDHVHRERLARINPDTYFACTDFKSNDGHTVDVDFFMKDNGKRLIMSDATIHKVDGKPRYNWKEKDGYWERVPVTD